MASGPVTHQRFFDLAGRMIRHPLGDGLRDIRYDAANRIVSFTHLATDGTPLPACDQHFGYDENSRITSITTNSASWLISHDANGNRMSVSLNGGPSVYTTEATSNRLTGSTNPARRFAYDAAGNTTADSAGYTARFNLRGQLAAITRGGATTHYTYNAKGQRVRKAGSTGPASTVLFMYDTQGHLLGEYDQAGVALREYVWLRDTPMAMFTPDPADPAGEPLVYFIQTDHLNAPRIVLDRENRQRWRWIAEPFGTTAPETDPQGLGVFTQNLRFPGQYADAESGLFYNQFRYYGPDGGRYTQSDPIGLLGASPSTYTYVDGDPLRYVDPNGLNPLAGAITGAEVGSILGPPGAVVGGVLGAGMGAWLGWQVVGPMLVKPPENAYDPVGPKAPGKPGAAEGFKDPKGGENWVRNPNGRGYGWQAADGGVWCPTGPDSGSRGDAHGGPHWDVEYPGGRYDNRYPGGHRR
jgi:RHS repeat-associated protein